MCQRSKVNKRHWNPTWPCCIEFTWIKHYASTFITLINWPFGQYKPETKKKIFCTLKTVNMQLNNEYTQRRLAIVRRERRGRKSVREQMRKQSSNHVVKCPPCAQCLWFDKINIICNIESRHIVAEWLLPLNLYFTSSKCDGQFNK